MADVHTRPRPPFAGITLAFLLFFAWSARRLNLRDRTADVQSLALFAANGAIYFVVAYRLLTPHYRPWLGLLAFAVAAASFLLSSRGSSQLSRQAALVEYLAGHAVLLFGLTLEIIWWAERSVAPQNLRNVETFAVSSLFAAYAVMLVSIGVVTRTAVNRIAGLVLIGVVIVKLYLFDVWQLHRVYRISAFVVLGVLLMGTSFLYSHWRRFIERWWKDDEASY